MHTSIAGPVAAGLIALLLTGCGTEEVVAPDEPSAERPSPSGQPQAAGHQVRERGETPSPGAGERRLQKSASKIVGDAIGGQ